jgi:hypothetical protein
MSVIFVPMANEAPFAGRTAGRVSGPSLSIIIASNAERARLETGLRTVLPGAASLGAEVIVARPDTPSQLSELARVFTGVRFVMASPGATRTELLALGMAEASGHIVALTDDERAGREDWNEILAHRSGIMRPGPGISRSDKAIDWLEHLKALGVAAPDSVS